MAEPIPSRAQPLLAPQQTAESQPTEPPYSVRNELRFFITQGLPLCVASILTSGVPAMANMIIAGHTSQSASLQASLGYARTYYIIVAAMPLGSLTSYFGAVLPGCIGAQRHDRIARYFWRSMLFTSCAMVPSLVLQCFATPILAELGVPGPNAAQVGIYCRLMLATSALAILATHLQVLLTNLGFVRWSALNALVSGLGVDVGLTLLLVLHLDLGVRGAALAQMGVQAAQAALWLGAATCHGVLRALLVPPAGSEASDPLCALGELRTYLGQALPEQASALADWGVFELQLLLATNIRGLPRPALAAGAIWITAEGALASVQSGWIAVSRMRTLKLLGRRDPGAPA